MRETGHGANRDSNAQTAEAIKELHHQNVTHDQHGYESFKPGCPTCDLLARIIARAVVVRSPLEESGS